MEPAKPDFSLNIGMFSSENDALSLIEEINCIFEQAIEKLKSVKKELSSKILDSLFGIQDITNHSQKVRIDNPFSNSLYHPFSTMSDPFSRFKEEEFNPNEVNTLKPKINELKQFINQRIQDIQEHSKRIFLNNNDIEIFPSLLPQDEISPNPSNKESIGDIQKRIKSISIEDSLLANIELPTSIHGIDATPKLYIFSNGKDKKSLNLLISNQKSLKACLRDTNHFDAVYFEYLGHRNLFLTRVKTNILIGRLLSNRFHKIKVLPLPPDNDSFYVKPLKSLQFQRLILLDMQRIVNYYL